MTKVRSLQLIDWMQKEEKKKNPLPLKQQQQMHKHNHKNLNNNKFIIITIYTGMVANGKWRKIG